VTVHDAAARRALWVLGCSWLLGAALTVYARSAPEPLPASAPASEFSQARALRILQLVAGDGRPRIPGSDASEQTLARLSGEIERLGLTPEHQRTFACERGVCGYVHNLLTRVEGREPGYVLLVAHHDSVGAGPGASDDGAGVAVLFETLRALRSGPPLRHGVMLLIGDAEEVGSLGATAFASEQTWIRDVRAVINVDNGGTTGLTLLHGIGAREFGVVDAYARAVRHPVSSSVFAVAQKYLPRFTDFNVFQRLGLPGMDFGFAGGPTRYHTALDSIAHCDPGSLQHEGNSVLASARALMAGDVEELSTSEGVWFDLFGAMLVRWTAGWSLGSALAAALLLGFMAWRRGLQLSAAALGCGVAFLVMFATGALAFALQLLLERAGFLPATFVAEPRWLFAAVASLALLCALGASFLLQRCDPRSIALGVCLAWAISAVVTGVFAPGATVLFVPVLLMAAGSLVLSGRLALIAHAVMGLTAAAVWFPAMALAPETFGISALPAFAAPAGWLTGLVLPSFAALSPGARRVLLLMAAGAWILNTGAHVLSRPFDARSPQRVNVIASIDVSANRSFAVVDTAWLGPRGPVPAAMQAALASLTHRRPYEASPFEWRASSALIAPMALLQPSAAVVDIQTAANATTLHVHLPQGPFRFSVFAEDSAPIRGLRLDAHLLRAARQPGRAGARYRVWTLFAPPRDATLEVEWAREQHPPTKLLLVTESAGVPEALRPLLQARPGWASPSQAGDRTVVSTRVVL
jgi:hypothetical protein